MICLLFKVTKMKDSTVGDRLRELLEEKVVTPYEAAKMTGISQAALSRVLNSHTAKLNIRNAALLSEYFNVNYEWLTTGKGEKRPQDYRPNVSGGMRASDVLAAYHADNSLIDSHNRLAKAMETIAESNKMLAESNLKATANSEKALNEMLRIVKQLENKK